MAKPTFRFLCSEHVTELISDHKRFQSTIVLQKCADSRGHEKHLALMKHEKVISECGFSLPEIKLVVKLVGGSSVHGA